MTETSISWYPSVPAPQSLSSIDVSACLKSGSSHLAPFNTHPPHAGNDSILPVLAFSQRSVADLNSPVPCIVSSCRGFRFLVLSPPSETFVTLLFL